MPASIIITFRFEGFHRWMEAPDEHAYLRVRHRHLFFVKAKRPVFHDNRDIEFIAFKREVEQYSREAFAETTMSCEAMARRLAERFGFSCVEVYEDGENGGCYEQE